MARTGFVLDPALNYVALAGDGSSSIFEGGEPFWTQPSERLDRIGAQWLVTEFNFSCDWPNWEMHPEADEFVYLVEGEADLLLQMPAGIQSVSLKGRGAVVVPKGVWHTAKTRVNCSMLHITMGKGTETRPSEP